MKLRKKWIIGLIISLILSSCLWIIAFVGPKTDAIFKESDVVELEGTFKRIEEKDDHYLISLQEAPFQLFIGKKEILCLEDLINLSEGETIYFGILKVVANSINSLDTIRVITLRIEEKNIITLESYNNVDQQISKKMKIGCIIGGIISLGIGIICIVKLGVISKK